MIIHIPISKTEEAERAAPDFSVDLPARGAEAPHAKRFFHFTRLPRLLWTQSLTRWRGVHTVRAFPN
jgi:hypothetical protein